MPSICTGKDCRRSQGYDKLLAALDGLPVDRVKCQDICKGPVAMVEIDGRATWFRRLRKGRHRRALAALLDQPPRRRRVPLELEDRVARFSRRGAA